MQLKADYALLIHQINTDNNFKTSQLNGTTNPGNGVRVINITSRKSCTLTTCVNSYLLFVSFISYSFPVTVPVCFVSFLFLSFRFVYLISFYSSLLLLLLLLLFSSSWFCYHFFVSAPSDYVVGFGMFTDGNPDESQQNDGPTSSLNKLPDRRWISEQLEYADPSGVFIPYIHLSAAFIIPFSMRGIIYLFIFF